MRRPDPLGKRFVRRVRVLYAHAGSLRVSLVCRGFGFPPLEAMLCDAPVIASDIAAAPLGDGRCRGVICNPYDVLSITAAIERLVASDESAVLRAGCDRPRPRAAFKMYTLDRCSRSFGSTCSHA